MGKIENIKFKVGVGMNDILDLLDESSKIGLTLKGCVFDEGDTNLKTFVKAKP